MAAPLPEAIFIEEDSDNEHEEELQEYVAGQTHILCHVKGFGLDDGGARYMVRPSRKIMCLYRTFAQAANVNWKELRVGCRRKLLSPYKTFEQCNIHHGDLLVAVLTVSIFLDVFVSSHSTCCCLNPFANL